MPDITFVNSPKTEESRLKMTRGVIASGFYAKHGFVVVPEINELVDEHIQVVYKDSQDYLRIDTTKWAKDWARVEESFWEEMEKNFKGCSEIFESIEVRITRYGTVSSSEKLVSVIGARKVFYLRHDVDISHLASIIINSILYMEKKDLGITWSKREALMDFVMTRPAMKKLFPHFRPMMNQLSRVPVAVRKESERYVRDLGIKMMTNVMAVVGGKLVIRGNVIGKELTKMEKKVMKLFVEKQGELVTYDDLADYLWGAGEFKSFWAINKMIERMRPKLSTMGVEGERMASVRGQGYILT